MRPSLCRINVACRDNGVATSWVAVEWDDSRRFDLRTPARTQVVWLQTRSFSSFSRFEATEGNPNRVLALAYQTFQFKVREDLHGRPESCVWGEKVPSNFSVGMPALSYGRSPSDGRECYSIRNDRQGLEDKDSAIVTTGKDANRGGLGCCH